MKEMNQFLTSIGLDPVVLLAILAVLLIILLFLLMRKKDEKEDGEGKAARIKAGIDGDPIIDKPKETTLIPDIVTQAEEEAPSLRPVQDVQISSEPSAPKAFEEQAAAVFEEPPVRVIAPEPMPMKAPEPDGRRRPNVDPMLESSVRFTPRELYFRPDKLVQIAVLLESSGLHSPVRCDYYNALTKRWSEDLKDNESCSEVLMSIQLVSSTGPIDEMECSRFIQVSNQVAIELEAEAEIPDSEKVIEAASKITALADGFDNTLTLCIRSEEAINETTLQDICQSQGFELDEGVFVKRLEGKKTPLLKIECPHQEGKEAKELTVALYVPLANASSNPLHGFLELCNELCVKLHGALQDNDGHLITSVAASAMERELKQLYALMRSRGIPAGGERAVRLYAH